MVKGPAITVGRSGSVGEVNFYNDKCWPHNTALYVKTFFKSYPKFIFYLLKTIDLKSLSEGTAVGTLNRNYIHNLIISIPEMQEQKNIAEFLDIELQKIDKLISKLKDSINKTQEYRTALISAAVTGKIDVRKEVT
jgi:type I restriction enzyme S subunit